MYMFYKKIKNQQQQLNCIIIIGFEKKRKKNHNVHACNAVDENWLFSLSLNIVFIFGLIN